MKLTILVFTLFLFLTPKFFVVAAQSATPTPIMCGIAGDPNRDSCCPVVRVGESIETEFRTMTTWVGPLNGILTAIYRILTESVFSVDQLEAIQVKCINGVPDPDTADSPAQCKCILRDRPVLNENMALLCKRYIDQTARPEEFNRCMQCASGIYESARSGESFGSLGGYYSALGCVPTSIEEFISNYVLRIGIGIAGMISLACIIYSAILLQVSQGNPDTITKAREQITSCVIGMLMIIFSIFILRVIGVEILRIPGFG